jgi:hypothetical protein
MTPEYFCFSSPGLLTSQMTILDISTRQRHETSTRSKILRNYCKQ